MIWWMSFDDSFEDEVKVTIIATWFNEQAKGPIQKRVPTNTRWDPIRKKSENFITRWINETIWWFTASQNWFSSSQTWGFSSTSVESPDLTNDAFRTPNNSEEDREMPAFMKKQLNNWEDKNDE
jgi:hypothetical protein